MIMETFRKWKRRDKPTNILELQGTWKNTIKSMFEELKIHKASTPEFKGGEWWLNLAKTAYDKRRGRSYSPRRSSSPRYETRRSSNYGMTSSNRERSSREQPRSSGHVKVVTTRDNDNRSTISQGRNGERYCFRCGHPDHYATVCDMY